MSRSQTSTPGWIRTTKKTDLESAAPTDRRADAINVPNSGSGIRTHHLRLMRPTSYHCSIPLISKGDGRASNPQPPASQAGALTNLSYRHHQCPMAPNESTNPKPNPTSSLRPLYPLCVLCVSPSANSALNAPLFTPKPKYAGKDSNLHHRDSNSRALPIKLPAHGRRPAAAASQRIGKDSNLHPTA